MGISTILDIIYIIGSALIVGIPAIIKILDSHKKLKNAQSEEEKLKAKEDMKEQMELFVQAAEIAYKEVNTTLKAQGSSAGPLKKDSVLVKLQNYANEKGYSCDLEYWSNAIDKFVESTRNVNSK